MSDDPDHGPQRTRWHVPDTPVVRVGDVPISVVLILDSADPALVDLVEQSAARQGIRLVRLPDARGL